MNAIWNYLNAVRLSRLPAFALLTVFLHGILRADTLDHWTIRPTPDTSNSPSTFLGVTYGQGKFVVVGIMDYFSSTDGVEWSPFEHPSVGYAYAVTSGPDRFLASGRSDIWSSSNGLSWVVQASPTNVYGLTGVAYGNGRYVIVGAAVLTSSNATDWTVQPMTNRPSGVDFINGWFFGTGSQESIMRSTNGADWTRQSFSSNGWLTGVAYGNGMYVAVGSSWNPIAGASDCTILTSTNGLDWQRNPFFLRRELSSVAYGDGYFVAVGTLGTILTSPDGLGWTSRDSGTMSNLKRVCYGNATFVVVGEDEIILQSDPLIRLDLQANPAARLTVNGPLGRSCRIECVEQLMSSNDWQALATVILTNPPVTHTDLNSTNFPRRIYRAVLLP